MIKAGEAVVYDRLPRTHSTMTEGPGGAVA